MTVKYEYKSVCCEHEYTEIRAADEPLFFPICNRCKSGNYELVTETVIADEVEREAGQEIPAE